MMKIKELKTGKKFESYQGSDFEMYLYEGNENYLTKVVEDAYKSELRTPEKGNFEFYRYNGKIYACINANFSSFARVSRRVDYRLKNNKWIQKINIRVVSEPVWNDHGFVDHYEYWAVRDK